ncbi:hypothetical protein D9M71_693350 [compost metagenome]
MFVNVQQVQFQERFFIHLVWRLKVREELVDLAVGEDGDSGTGNVEVPEQLACMVDVQRLPDFLALNQNLNLAIL